MTEPEPPYAPPTLRLELDRENVKALHKLWTEPAAFLDWTGSGSIEDEAEEYLGIGDATGWLRETLTNHATWIDQALTAAEDEERNREDFSRARKRAALDESAGRGRSLLTAQDAADAGED